MRRHLIASFVCAFCLWGCSTIPDTPTFTRADRVPLTAARIDSEVERLMTAARVPGLGLALIEDGRIAYLKAYGHRDVDEALPLTPDTIMFGASLTKAAFAHLCLQLVDEGLLSLDKPIAEYLPRPLPEYERYADLKSDQRWRLFTPRMLLSHTSGMRNWRWLAPEKKLDIKFQPGTRYAYSGEGIQLMQFVLEEGLKLNVGAEMQRRVFDRFGMGRTAMTWRDDFRTDYANRYLEDGKSIGHDMRREVQASASMDTTLSDYAKFLAGVVRGDGLSRKVQAEMLGEQIAIMSAYQFPTDTEEDSADNRRINLGYGLGWGRFVTPYGPAFFKEGHDDGTNNYALCIQEGRRCMLILANSSNAESIYLYLANALLGKTNLPWYWEGFFPYDQPPPPPSS